MGQIFEDTVAEIELLGVGDCQGDLPHEFVGISLGGGQLSLWSFRAQVCCICVG